MKGTVLFLGIVLFLVSGVWAGDSPNPLDPPIQEMMNNVISSGAKILVCPPCAKVRGYGEDDLLDGVVIAGAPAMLEVVKQGASTLSF